MRKALVVLSGGQDSTTCLFWAKHQFDEVHAITFDGQRHKAELKAAGLVACLADVASHTFVKLGEVLKGSSPLINRDEELDVYTDAADMKATVGDKTDPSFVPMRNALFLTVAANHALALGCQTIVTGVCGADAANFPDCTSGFISAVHYMINVAIGQEPLLSVEAPFITFTKAQIIELALRISGAYEALAFTHTAYDGQYPPTGRDHASLLREQGFLEAGVPDPLVIRAVDEGLMDLPPTVNYLDAMDNSLLGQSIRKCK